MFSDFNLISIKWIFVILYMSIEVILNFEDVRGLCWRWNEKMTLLFII